MTNLSPSLVTYQAVTIFGDQSVWWKSGDHQIWWQNGWQISHYIRWQMRWSSNLVTNLVTNMVTNLMTNLVTKWVITRLGDHLPKTSTIYKPTAHSIISASSVHHGCIISAKLLHYQPIISCWSAHHEIIIKRNGRSFWQIKIRSKKILHYFGQTTMPFQHFLWHSGWRLVLPQSHKRHDNGSFIYLFIERSTKKRTRK